jgi:hypothetical protein
MCRVGRRRRPSGCRGLWPLMRWAPSVRMRGDVRQSGRPLQVRRRRRRRRPDESRRCAWLNYCGFHSIRGRRRRRRGRRARRGGSGGNHGRIRFGTPGRRKGTPEVVSFDAGVVIVTAVFVLAGACVAPAAIRQDKVVVWKVVGPSASAGRARLGEFDRRRRPRGHLCRANLCRARRLGLCDGALFPRGVPWVHDAPGQVDC